MLSDGNKYGLSEYDKSILVVRRPYLPLVIFFGKKQYTYWLTMPPSTSEELRSEFFKWFHKDFVEIVSHIVKRRNVSLEEGQEKPSRAGGKYGWYLPIAVVLELEKMWADENVPIIWELLRPTNFVYGKS